MDQNKISKACLLSWEIPEYCNHEKVKKSLGILNPLHMRENRTHPGLILEDIVKACQEYPERFLAGYCPDPLNPNASNLFLEAYKKYDVKVCGEWKFTIRLDDPRCLKVFLTAGKVQTPVLVHLDVPYLPPIGGKKIEAWYGGTIKNLENALKLCPETNFIGHGPGFWRELYDDSDIRKEVRPDGPATKPGRVFKLLESYKNLYADLSANSGLVALKRDYNITREFLNKFQNQILFGRDCLGDELQSLLNNLNLEKSTSQKIYSSNARKLISF
jgi:predicted TIM-barrel fold metal-dependent hydrolase